MNNERGIAMPMALIVMVILTALMAGFAVLATSEPQIASNHVASAQARALAESGVERALWALTAGQNPTPPSGALVLAAGYTLPSPLPAPYDGSAEVALGVGTFKVTVANGPQLNQKLLTAIGYVPNATNPIAIKKIQVTATRLNWIDPVCGLCAGGENPPGTTTTITVGGTAAVNATTSAQSGPPPLSAGAFCSGVTPLAAIATTGGGTVSVSGSPDLYAPGPGSTTLTGTAATLNNASFPPTMTLSDSDMATLKAMAQSQGTYYKPSSPGGTITWTSPPPNGIIFVDTYSGNPLTASSPASDLSDPLVDIHGTWSSGWSGWLIVAGSIQISGQPVLSGLIYAQNDVQLNGTGNGAINGAVISTNRVDTTSSTIADNTDIGNAPLRYDCPAVRSGGGALSQNWFLVPGTYREVSGTS